MAPRLLVFDLDGTLIDSTLDLCNSVNAALAHVGKPTLPNALITTYVGDGAAMLVRRALGDPEDLDSQSPTETSPIFEQAFDHFLTYYRAHKLDNTLPYPGVLEALAEIRARHPHILMAVLTNKPVLPSRAICDALNLSPYFFQNYGGNSFPTKKPDPEGLQTLIAEANQLASSPHPILPADTLMIGDSDVDIRTARAIGARTLGCLYGLSPHSLQASNPDRLVATPADIPSAIFT
ncbi:MAG: HAD hydrolase-like protein [Acidobacteriota bacterium]